MANFLQLLAKILLISLTAAAPGPLHPHPHPCSVSPSPSFFLSPSLALSGALVVLHGDSHRARLAISVVHLLRQSLTQIASFRQLLLPSCLSVRSSPPPSVLLSHPCMYLQLASHQSYSAAWLTDATRGEASKSLGPSPRLSRRRHATVDTHTPLPSPQLNEKTPVAPTPATPWGCEPVGLTWSIFV